MVHSKTFMVDEETVTVDEGSLTVGWTVSKILKRDGNEKATVSGSRDIEISRFKILKDTVNEICNIEKQKFQKNLYILKWGFEVTK